MAHATHGTTTGETKGVDDAVDLLGDRYACRILAALDDGPMAAVDLADVCDASRATIYRRLSRLEAAGFVGSGFELRSDGNHRKQFHLEVREVQFTVTEDGYAARPGTQTGGS